MKAMTLEEAESGGGGEADRDVQTGDGRRQSEGDSHEIDL